MAEIIREHGPFHGMLEGFARASFMNTCNGSNDHYIASFMNTCNGSNDHCRGSKSALTVIPARLG